MHMKKEQNLNERVNYQVIVLAAGQGKRMRSALPKVLHPVAGEALLTHSLRAIDQAQPQTAVALVLGVGRDQVMQTIHQAPASKRLQTTLEITEVEQAQPLGTGDAVRSAMDSPWGKAALKKGSPLLVLPGDTPLIRPEMISHMGAPLPEGTVIRLLTCHLEDPTGYGRVIQTSQGGVKIVEEKDTSEKEREVQEVAVSTYLFEPNFLNDALGKLSRNNAQGEFYLTDLVEMAGEAGKKVEILRWKNSEDLLGVNNRWELSQVGKILNQRLLKAWAIEGVHFVDPDSTWVEASVFLGEDVKVDPGVIIQGDTQIGSASMIGSNCSLKNVKIGKNVTLKPGCVLEDSVVHESATLGPYAHLRPGSEVGVSAKIGNFVELKKSKIGAHTSVAHLSYLGDAEVGERVNIGCGFVTCNYDGQVKDGKRKHTTVIEDEVFVGSDCQTVAPVRLKKGSYIASGSTITQDVEEGALAIARSRQVNKPGYAKRLVASKK
jgi:bifunctional UDP-N-acetylglucosamine pyrophosphorylase / glucosamine-1-phosphate N-acetyltransferase